MGPAREIDAELLAHERPATVAGDRIVGGERHRAVRRLGRHGNGIVILRDADHAMPEAQDCGRRLDERAVGPADQLELLALQPERIGGVLAQQCEVEFGDLAEPAVAVLHRRRLQAHGQQGGGRGRSAPGARGSAVEGRGR